MCELDQHDILQDSAFLGLYTNFKLLPRTRAKVGFFGYWEWAAPQETAICDERWAA
jgi:hypothetical protein